MSFSEDFRNRTKKFAIEVVRFYRDLPNTGEAQVLGKQLLRSATSTAANYRAACRARSKAEFIAKLGIVVEEADESAFWLELFEETKITADKRLQILLAEATEIIPNYALEKI